MGVRRVYGLAIKVGMFLVTALTKTRKRYHMSDNFYLWSGLIDSIFYLWSLISFPLERR